MVDVANIYVINYFSDGHRESSSTKTSLGHDPQLDGC
jgi:hypothetical protein